MGVPQLALLKGVNYSQSVLDIPPVSLYFLSLVPRFLLLLSPLLIALHLSFYRKGFHMVVIHFNSLMTKKASSVNLCLEETESKE